MCVWCDLCLLCVYVECVFVCVFVLSFVVVCCCVVKKMFWDVWDKKCNFVVGRYVWFVCGDVDD